MISHIRTNILGYIMRTVHSGIAAGVVTPEGPGAASASLALIHARQNSVCWISSASMPCTCRCWSILVDFAIAKASPIMNSDFAQFLVENWCMICGMMPVRFIEPVAQRGIAMNEDALP